MELLLLLICVTVNKCSINSVHSTFAVPCRRSAISGALTLVRKGCLHVRKGCLHPLRGGYLGRMSDEQDRRDEADALEAIFPDDFRRLGENSWEVKVDIGKSFLLLRLLLPEGYPSRENPLYEIHADWINHLQMDTLCEQLDQIADDSLGEVVVFKWIEFLRESLEFLGVEDSLQPEANNSTQHADEDEGEGEEEAELAAKLAASDIQAKSPAAGQNILNSDALQQWERRILHGETFVDRKSVFQAHLAPVHCIEDVQEMLAVLKSNNKIARATHNIMAYRIERKQSSFTADCDDDGETAAGGRLLHLLNIIDARNVCVVVSRWYGGIMLGPDRFKHINNVARDLLSAHGYVTKAPDAGGSGKSAKR